MTEKYIKASECEKYFYEHLDDNGMIGAMNAIDEMPSADVQPVKRGRWIEHHDLIECNVCGFEVKDTYCEKRDMTSSETSYDYCPKCGAYMRGDENG